MRNSIQFYSIALAPSLTKSFKIILHILARHELDVFLLYLLTGDKNMNKYAHIVMKNTDPNCPILVTLLTLFYTFLCQTSAVLITASTKAVMTVT